jgi:uncharacterized protein (TIGR04222 family)
MSAATISLISTLLLIGGVVAGLWYRRWAVAARPGRHRPEPTAYQLAAMVGGGRRVAEVAAAFLVWNGVFEVRENSRRLVLASPPSPSTEFHPVERAMINAAGLEGAQADRVLGAGRLVAAEKVGGDLAGLAIPPSERSRLAAIPSVTGLVVALVVGWWMLATDSPLGWTPVVCAVALVVAALGLVEVPYATGAGRELIARRREELSADYDRLALGITALPVVSAMTILALEGRLAMNGELTPLRNVTR